MSGARKLAREQDLNTYTTGKPCKHGHISFRYTDSGVCYECLRISVGVYRTRHREEKIEYCKQWRKDNPEYYRTYYSNNKQNSQGYSKNWKDNNPDKTAKLVDRRRDLLKQATPRWYHEEEHLVKQLYLKRDELRKTLKVDLTVDHIIPIQGKDVCGLHCWANLQLLERSDNGAKINNYQKDW